MATWEVYKWRNSGSMDRLSKKGEWSNRAGVYKLQTHMPTLWRVGQEYLCAGATGGMSCPWFCAGIQLCWSYRRWADLFALTQNFSLPRKKALILSIPGQGAKKAIAISKHLAVFWIVT